MLPPFSVPDSSTNPTVPIYRIVRDELAETLSRTLGSAWRLMCLFLVGVTENEASPSIVVMVEPRTHCDWTRLEGSVMTHLARSLPKDLAINVEFLPGGCGDIPSPETATMPGISFRERIPENCLPTMGCSIGVEGETGDCGGSSLGGFVTLTIGNKIHKGFLTTHHVVQPPSNSTNAEPTTIRHAARYGYSYFSASHQPRLDVHFFAVKDAIATREDLESSIESLYRDIKYFRTKQVVGREEIINRIHATINSYQNMLEKVRTMPKTLGRVLVSSGRAIDGGSSKHILDWAFVELDDGPQRDQVFNCNILPEISRAESPSLYTRQGDYGLAGLPAMSFGAITPGVVL